MMLRLIYLFVFSFLIGCSDPRSDREKVRDYMLIQLAKHMKKEGLIAIGSGGGCTLDKKINLISMTFEYPKVMTMDEGRALLVNSIQTLLNLINSNPENSKYFEHFPVPVDIILISILGEICPQDPNCVEIVKIIQGVIHYNVNHPLPNVAPYLNLKKESFEEAQKIVASKTTHE